jgi:PAS domain S-box-containing protein
VPLVEIEPMSDQIDQQHTEHDVLTDRSSLSVLYVTLADEVFAGSTESVTPAVLEAEQGLDIHVFTSLPDALDRLIEDTDLDCVVVESTDTGDAERALMREASVRQPPVPVIVYADGDTDPEMYSEYIDDGIVGYLPHAADSDERSSLTHRIEHCVELRRERVTTNQLRAAVDGMGHFVLIAETDGTIVYANDAVEDLGYNPDPLAGRSLSFLQRDADNAGVLRELRETVSSGGHWSGELTLETPDGKQIVDLTATPLQADDGDIRRIIVVGDDITERKRRKKRLRSFQMAVEQAGHVIMITDTDGRIEYVNPAFESVTGYSRDEALGETPALLNSGRHDDEFYRDLWETIKAGDIWEGELVNERSNGEQYYIRQTIAPVTDADGDIEQFVAVNTDITESKQRQYQIKRERDRLEEFTQTIAHDLRNPLTIALSQAEAALHGDDLPDGALRRVIDALERMETLVSEALLLSKQGQTIDQPQSVSLAETATRAWSLVDAPNATLEIADDLDDWSLEGDETRLCTVFENLFRNAVEHGKSDDTAVTDAPEDATDNETTQSVSSPDRNAGGDGTGSSALTVRVGRLDDREGFFVVDDGAGISTTDRTRVFDTGFTTAEDGTGFGLAIVTQIVKAHDWVIDLVESADGGARFEITTGDG